MKQALVFAALSLVLFAAPGRAETQIQRGRYLVDTLAACGNCHTPRGPNGPQMDKYLAGGDHIRHKDFDAVSANITPDPETGIGRWSDAQLFKAIREGQRPDGSLIGPAMPSKAYREMANDDVKAIIAYLRTVPPVKNAVTEEIKIPICTSGFLGPRSRTGHGAAKDRQGRLWRLSCRPCRPLHGVSYPTR